MMSVWTCGGWQCFDAADSYDFKGCVLLYSVLGGVATLSCHDLVVLVCRSSG